MILSKHDGIRVMMLQRDYGELLSRLMNDLVKGYIESFGRYDSEWEMTRQAVEFCAKRQALKDLMNILERRYE